MPCHINELILPHRESVCRRASHSETHRQDQKFNICPPAGSRLTAKTHRTGRSRRQVPLGIAGIDRRRRPGRPATSSCYHHMCTEHYEICTLSEYMRTHACMCTCHMHMHSENRSTRSKLDRDHTLRIDRLDHDRVTGSYWYNTTELHATKP